MNSALEVSEAQSAAVQITPHRVTLDQVNDAIENVEFINPESAPQLTIAVAKLKNGFIVTGKSACADPANFNKDLGEKFALENAKRKIWDYLGYNLCEKLAVKPASNDTEDPAQQAAS